MKFGRAALYKTLQEAEELAQLLVSKNTLQEQRGLGLKVLKTNLLAPLQVSTGNGMGVKTGAVLSRMEGTIGRCVGNSLEVIESLEALKGNGPDDLMELVTMLGNDSIQMSSGWF